MRLGFQRVLELRDGNGFPLLEDQGKVLAVFFTFPDLHLEAGQALGGNLVLS